MQCRSSYQWTGQSNAVKQQWFAESVSDRAMHRCAQNTPWSRGYSQWWTDMKWTRRASMERLAGFVFIRAEGRGFISRSCGHRRVPPVTFNVRACTGTGFLTLCWPKHSRRNRVIQLNQTQYKHKIFQITFKKLNEIPTINFILRLYY